MVDETFFTTIGCMDGRCQEIVDNYGRQHFHAMYPDTITEAGLVGILSHEPSPAFLEQLKKKILISLETHHSRGIVVDGHAECAGNPVDDRTHIANVHQAVKIISNMIHNAVPVVGVYICRCPQDRHKWEINEEMSSAVV